MNNLAFQDPRSSPAYWEQRHPGFCWAPCAYTLLAQEFVNTFDYEKNGFKPPFQPPENKNENKKMKIESET